MVRLSSGVSLSEALPEKSSQPLLPLLLQKIFAA